MKQTIIEEKATSLIKIFYHSITGAINDRSFEIAMQKGSKEFLRASACALLCADQIIDNHYSHFGDTLPSVVKYWQEIKESIKSLK